MNTPLVSFIIPAYNVDLYIEKCIHSIQCLDDPDWELIVIDDGSCDNTLQICKELSKKDNRINVFSQQNAGASAARNFGLDKAKGVWISFIDADDWIDSNYLSLLNEAPESDILFFGFKEWRESRVTVQDIDSIGNYDCNDIDQSLTALFVSKATFLGFTWNKFYRKSIIDKHNLRFDEDLIIKEDEEFIVRYCRVIKKLYISRAVPYNYRILSNSISHRKLKSQRMNLLAKRIECELVNYPFPKFREAMLNAVYRYYQLGVIESVSSNSINQSIIDWDKFAQYHRDILSECDYLWIFNCPLFKLRYHLIKFVLFSPIYPRLKPSYFKYQVTRLIKRIK